MKNLSTVLIALVASSAMAADQGEPTLNVAPAQKTESQSLRDKIEAQVNRLNFNVDERNRQIMDDVEAKYGFNVQCDRGFAGLWSALKDGSCALGLSSLDKALADLEVPVDREYLSSVTLEVTEAGQWQGITFTDRQIKVPYNAHPERIKEFVNKQLDILFNTSVNELEQENAQIVQELRDQYYYNVIPDENVDAAEFHEGLQRLRIAAQRSYGTVKPSREEFEKFGFDTVVIGKKYRGLYEDQGELRVKVDMKDSPGQLFLQLINQVDAPKTRFGKVMNFPLTSYSWNDVTQFRQLRAEVQQFREEIAGLLPEQSVDCLLDSKKNHSVNMAECHKGLRRLRESLYVNGQPTRVVEARPIIISDNALARRFQSNRSGALMVDYSNSVESMRKALTAKEDMIEEKIEGTRSTQQ